jgi:3-isopropylmalate dehydrogenase
VTSRRIAVIPGDGIGPEVIGQALRIVRFYQDERGLPLELWPLDLGAERYLRDGATLPDAVRDEIGSCAAVLLGALGDPRVPDSRHAREILFGLRFGFDLYANVRPARALVDRLVPLRGRSAADVNFVVFRENTEGPYVGMGGQFKRGTADEIAINEDVNTRKGVERILRVAFEYAVRHGCKRLHMADKSNALRFAHELWLRVFDELRPAYPQVEARHLYVDALCLHLIRNPAEFEVIVTSNLLGDIVTDLAAALQGGLGMAASANLNPSQPDCVALFEPVHGSAPDLVGRGIANPSGAIASVGMLLSHLGYAHEEERIERALREVLEAGIGTPDVGGSAGSELFTSRVLERLRGA